MAYEQTKDLFIKIVQELQEKIPAGQEKERTKLSGDGDADKAVRQQLQDLVPQELREQALKEGLELSDDEAFGCVNRVAGRAQLRPDMSMVSVMFFAHPFWKPLFEKAQRSGAAAAKRSQAKE